MDTGLEFFVPIHFTAWVLAMVSGVFLILKSHERRPSLYLGIFLLAYAMDIFLAVLLYLDWAETRPYLYFLPLNFWFLSAPLLYVYFRELVKPVKLLHRVVHFIPGALEFTVLSILMILVYLGELDGQDADRWQKGIGDYFDVGLVYSSVYYLLIIIKARKRRAHLGDFYSSTLGRDLRWIEYTCYAILFQVIAWFLVYYIPVGPIYSGVVLALYIINISIICWIIVKGIKQQSLAKDHAGYMLESVISTTEAASPRSNASDNSISLSSLSDIDTIVSLVESDKMYLDPDLQVKNISSKVGISARRVSEIIKEHTGLNFKSFINEYRLKESQRLLLSDKAIRLTMDAIAEESGFKSRATFYALFKETNDCSPSSYRKSNLDSKVS